MNVTDVFTNGLMLVAEKFVSTGISKEKRYLDQHKHFDNKLGSLKEKPLVVNNNE